MASLPSHLNWANQHNPHRHVHGPNHPSQLCPEPCQVVLDPANSEITLTITATSYHQCSHPITSKEKKKCFVLTLWNLTRCQLIPKPYALQLGLEGAKTRDNRLGAWVRLFIWLLGWLIDLLFGCLIGWDSIPVYCPGWPQMPSAHKPPASASLLAETTSTWHITGLI